MNKHLEVLKEMHLYRVYLLISDTPDEELEPNITYERILEQCQALQFAIEMLEPEKIATDTTPACPDGSICGAIE